MSCILAVEDSRTQAELVRADLERAGYTVRLARDGLDALDQLAEGGIDLVLSDVVMPGMDGYELCRRVKAEPATCGVPVVLLTTLADPLDVVSGLEAGADNFLRKPYQREQLLSRLRTTLEHQRTPADTGGETKVQLSFLDREFQVTAERQQVLDLLISTFEELVLASRDLRAREEELSRAHTALQQQLRATEVERSRLQAVVDTVPVPLFVIGADDRVLHVSAVSAPAFGLDMEAVGGLRAEQLGRLVDAEGTLVPTEDLPHRRAMREGRPVTAGAAFDLFTEREDGSRLPLLLQASPILDDEGVAIGCVSTAQVLGALTQHDPVTGLPNRVAFLDQLADLSTSGQGQLAVLLVELDRLDVVRASLGEQAEQAVAMRAARTLRQALSTAATGHRESFLASTGTGQFGIVVAPPAERLAVVHLAERVRQGFQDGDMGGASAGSVSVGVALGERAGEVTTLLAGAGAALHRARENGGDLVEVFGPGASQEAMEQLQLERDLRRAVQRDQIVLHFQPEVDLATGHLLAFEALARWHHDQLGAVRPDRFIALAEQSNLVVELGRQVLVRACREARRWQDADGPPVAVAVNISAAQLRPAFVGEVLEVLQETGLDPARLMIELTETVAMRDPGATVAVLEELRTHGLRFSVDDFGTGYSSLAQLTRIPFDQLKLDRSFVQALDRGGSDALVAQSIVALGHALEVPVIAEGVEEERQAGALRRLGCDQAQGYLFSRPLAPEQAWEYLLGHRQRH